MAPHHRVRNAFIACSGAIGLLAASCGSSTPSQTPVIGSVVGFDQPLAVQGNGILPTANAPIACGTDKATFGTELLTTPPTEAKVTNEWGEIVPGALMAAAGTVNNFQFSMGDLPFTHPFDKDVTFDVNLQTPYQKLAQTVGTGEPEATPGLLHWELSRGEFPHQDATTYLPGFVPQDGDQVATVGHWIIDCGHDDYHTEIHPAMFVAFGHPQGSATATHAFYAPYYETQIYTPLPDLVTQFDNVARFNDPNSLTFPQYLTKELIRVGHAGPAGPLCCADRLESHMLLDPNDLSPVAWYVCAPGPKPSGASLAETHQFTVRPGVSITATANEDIGCVQFTAAIGKAFTPAVPARKDCALPWSVLNQQAQAAEDNPDLDVEAAIEKLFAPLFPKYVNSVKKDPIVDCFDPPVVPPPGGGAQNQSTVTTSSDQPFPFYGAATVSWKK